MSGGSSGGTGVGLGRTGMCGARAGGAVEPRWSGGGTPMSEVDLEA